jgi:hypothetical protein
VIDFTHETLLNLFEARSQFPGIPHLNTIRRWTLQGFRGVVLESLKIGSRRYTTREAVVRFINQLSAQESVVHNTLTNAGRCVDHEVVAVA